jgi:hypothetical protein
MSEDKVCTKDPCWSVGKIYDPRELPGLSTISPVIGQGVTSWPACQRTLALGADLGCRSVIGWLRTPRTPSCGFFVKEPLWFQRINMWSYFIVSRPLVSCRESHELYFNHRNRFNLVFLNAKTCLFHIFCI